MCKQIIKNKRANYQYFIIQKFEAGIALLGWEVKSIRFKKVEINHGYIIIKQYEAYLQNVTIHPLTTSCSYIHYKNSRTRKLLLNKNELHTLYKKNKIKKYTIIPLELYWKNNWIKIKIGLAQGKKKYDKRMEIKNREWKLDKKYIFT